MAEHPLNNDAPEDEVMEKLNFRLAMPEQLFGNDAAEDEEAEVFESYAISRMELRSFLDTTRPLQVVRAYKGEGKSALLRLVESHLKTSSPDAIIIRTTGQAISPEAVGTDSDRWVRAWKRQFLSLIAAEIGARISVAVKDDSISLVEEAERNGFKQRSFVSAITDRLASKMLPLQRQRSIPENLEPVVKRWLEKGTDVWLFIDDIDQNFRNDAEVKVKVASCFIAARQIFNQIPEIKIRLAIRPNTWTTMKPDFEALSHIEQYMVDLPWSSGYFLDLLARRIRGYLERTNQWQAVAGKLPQGLTDQYEFLTNFVFESPVPWGGGRRPIHVALHTLSRHRPRWLVELCKVSAAEAHRKGHDRILLEDVVNQLEAFGQRRIQDTIAEFKAQCPQLEQLIVAFSGQNERYTTDQLIRTIRDRILQGVMPRIDGIVGNPGAREVAHFLYQIGFLSARRDDPSGTYVHFAFAERPNLLRATTNLDEGMSWEIHPVFRNYLRLKDVESKSESAKRERKRDSDK